MRSTPVILLVALVRIASADPPGMTPIGTPLPVGPPPAAADDKDATVAVELSVGGTVLSIGMFAIGAKTNSDQLAFGGLVSSMVTPSIGEWYAGEYLTWGMGIRAASASIALAGFAEAFCFDDCEGSNQRTGDMLFVIGAIGSGAGMIYDIVHAPAAVKKHNERHRANLMVTPTAYPTSTGPAPGVMVGGSF
jgi:hypothetical protein